MASKKKVPAKKKVKPAKPAAKKAAKPAKAAAKEAAKPSAAKQYGARADLGAPIDAFFAKQPPALRPIVEALREIIEQAAPDAESAIKWGMPFFSIRGEMLCAIGAHKSHVNLILHGAPDTFADPDGLLTGESKMGRHLKLTKVEDLPRRTVQAWVRTAVEQAKKA
jgi:hypothetical protein